MPYPRFEKLAREKRELLLDVAAREFAIYGFSEASINRILEHAQMSKGATYYYFEDKVDLFCTVVRYASDTLQLSSLDADVAALSAETFWPTFADLHRLPLLRSFDRPWLFMVLNVAGDLPRPLREREPLARLSQQIRSLAMRLIHRGQELGVIRTDLSDDLLYAWLHAIDQASDTWLVDHWDSLDRATVAQVSDQTVEAMSKAVAAPER